MTAKRPPHLPVGKEGEQKPFMWGKLALLGGILFFISCVAAFIIARAIMPIPEARVFPRVFEEPVSYLQGAQKASLSQVTADTIRERIVTVYDKRHVVAQEYILPSADVGQGILLNEQGWIAVYGDLRQAGVTRLLGVTRDGVHHDIDDLVYDSLVNVTYLLLAGDGYRGDVPLYSWRTTPVGDSIAAYAHNADEFLHVQVRQKQVNEDKTPRRKLWTPKETLVVESHRPVGALLFDDHGSFVGMQAAENILLEGWLVELQLSSLFESGKIRYNGVVAAGRPIVGHIKEGEEKVTEQYGFLVEQVPTRASSSTLGYGDIITHVGGEVFDAQRTPWLVLRAIDVIPVEVIRDDVSIQLLLEKQQVHP